MRLEFPVDEPYLVTQWYEENANPFYKENGLDSHGAIDVMKQYDSPIRAAIDAEVYSTINKDNLNLGKYRAVFQIFDDIDFSYEIAYGHCNKILAAEKTKYAAGDIIATIGNTGDVYSGGIKVTLAEKMKGSHAGHHLHFQVRKCKRVPKRDTSKHYLRDSNGFLKRNGMFYEIVDYNNGNNGCVDPNPSFGEPKVPFRFDMNVGVEHEDVQRLQKWLNANGFTVAKIGPGSPGNETYYYGELTRKAVLRLQEARRAEILTPAGLSKGTGTFGPRTRNYINNNL